MPEPKKPVYHPCFRYHPEKPPVIVTSEEHEKELGPGWFKSPADYGMETCPSSLPDPAIAALAAKRKKASSGR